MRIVPDLSGVSSQTKLQLLQNTLDPSREIQPRFTNCIMTTTDGRILDGLTMMNGDVLGSGCPIAAGRVAEGGPLRG
jgi:hypothetical protein